MPAEPATKTAGLSQADVDSGVTKVAVPSASLCRVADIQDALQQTWRLSNPSSCVPVRWQCMYAFMSQLLQDACAFPTGRAPGQLHRACHTRDIR